MRRAKLNTHTDASGNLCAHSPIQLGVTSRNGQHEISGASACRCRSCLPKPMCGTQRWFLTILDLKIFFKMRFISLMIKSQSESERTLDYISGVDLARKPCDRKPSFFNFKFIYHSEMPVGCDSNKQLWMNDTVSWMNYPKPGPSRISPCSGMHTSIRSPKILYFNLVPDVLSERTETHHDHLSNLIECFTRWTNLVSHELASSTGLQV